jgi:hypothetical protein
VGTFETRPDASTPQGTTAGIDLAHDIHKVWFYMVDREMRDVKRRVDV